MQQLRDIFESWYSMPILPTSVLVSVLAVYWLIVLVGALDLEFLDWDFDLHLETDANILDVGLVPLRFLNLGRIPVMIWTSLFGLSAWVTSIVIHKNWIVELEQSQSHAVVIAESIGIALLLTKLITNPLSRWFDVEEPNRPETLIGGTCTITPNPIPMTIACQISKIFAPISNFPKKDLAISSLTNAPGPSRTIGC